MKIATEARSLVILSILLCCYGDNRGLNLNDLLASINNNNNNNHNSNNDQQSAVRSPPAGFATTSVKTQEFTDLPALLAAMKNGGGENNANLDINALLRNKEAQSSENPPTQQQQQQQSIEVAQNDKDSSNNNENVNGVNLANLATLLGNKLKTNNEQKEEKAPLELAAGNKEESGHPGVAIETDGDNTQSGHSHFTLQRSPDGGLMLVPIKEETGASRGLELADLAKKVGGDVGAVSRQQLQLTTLAQALYSPFPGDQNTLHLHLKGKDGKDGKLGPVGHPGTAGPLGSAGAKGPKGEQGTCVKEVTHQPYTCTPDEMDSLASRVDYLEKVCKKQVPTTQIKPSGEKGGEGNPLPNCQSIYEKDPNAKSGAYWLMVNGVRFKTWCEFIKGGGTDESNRPGLDGGWTLVARIKGQSTDWSPVAENWASNQTLNEKTAHDIKSMSSMKNMGYVLLKSNVLLLCFTGQKTGCAPFTHGRNMPLAKLFSTQFGVVPDEQYTFATFMKSVGKSCDLSILRQSWCGLNLANVCDPKNSDPNQKPPKTTHIARIGCIGDRTATCFPDDYAIGIGVTSCKDGFGCSNVDASKNMHYRCDYVYGAFSQTAYLYVL